MIRKAQKKSSSNLAAKVGAREIVKERSNKEAKNMIPKEKHTNIMNKKTPISLSLFVTAQKPHAMGKG